MLTYIRILLLIICNWMVTVSSSSSSDVNMPPAPMALDDDDYPYQCVCHCPEKRKINEDNPRETVWEIDPIGGCEYDSGITPCYCMTDTIASDANILHTVEATLTRLIRRGNTRRTTRW
ncbi:hypothetical protein FOZ63_008632 [Perkinsus olseni]|uniref:Uncharacterized protein n=1 Tax=Perkinsus olseni TaxID=32597 RepID=A0A7J6T1G5_PEROL|nr:hypothetical protein FOZ62_011633 [Perkinsus olseni]KAF4756698.1 hypothetical protein FOZ63_008632 [Perkinsus olseni]